MEGVCRAGPPFCSTGGVQGGHQPRGAPQGTVPLSSRLTHPEVAVYFQLPVPGSCWQRHGVGLMERPQSHGFSQRLTPGEELACESDRHRAQLGLLRVQLWATRPISEPWFPHLGTGHTISTSYRWSRIGPSKELKALCEPECSVLCISDERAPQKEGKGTYGVRSQVPHPLRKVGEGEQ